MVKTTLYFIGLFLNYVFHDEVTRNVLSIIYLLILQMLDVQKHFILFR